MRIVNDGQRALVALETSLDAIGDAGGATKTAAHRWRNGTGKPRANAREKMQAALGIDVEAWDRDTGESGATKKRSKRKAGSPRPAKTPKKRTASRTSSGTSKPARGVVVDAVAPYPTAPPVDASPIVAVRHTLACIRHDMQRRDLAIASISKLRADESRSLTLLSKLERENEMTEARYVREHPEFRAHCRRILEALKPYPKAAQAVAAALGAT